MVQIMVMTAVLILPLSLQVPDLYTFINIVFTIFAVNVALSLVALLFHLYIMSI